MSTNAPLQTTQTTNFNDAFYDHLVDCYVEFDDFSIAMALQQEPLRVDDQDEDDVDWHFCKIEVMPATDVPDQFELRITNSPFTEELYEGIGFDGVVTNRDDGRSRADIFITTSTKDVTYLRKLAKAYRKMVGKGASYPDPNWKWVCRRTADSLDRLADNVWKFRSRRVRNP